MVSFLESKHPRSKYKSAEDWAKALIDEITAMPEAQRLPEEAEAVAKLFLSCAAFSHELFQQELMLDEWLDAMIDRAVKRLIHMKTIKQVLEQTSPSPSVAPESADTAHRLRDRAGQGEIGGIRSAA